MSNNDRIILNQKISLENWLKARVLKLHTAVLKDSLKRKDVNLLRYKISYTKLLTNANKKINKVNNIDFYNNLFLNQNVDDLLLSLQNFFIKKNFPTVKALSIQENIDSDSINEAVLLLPLKSGRDSQYFVQNNYERQNLINNVSSEEDDEDNEEAIMLAIASGQAIKSNKKKRWNDVNDARVRATHSHANGQIRDINDTFDVGGYKLMFPGDSSFGADPRVWANCRCYLTFI